MKFINKPTDNISNDDEAIKDRKDIDQLVSYKKHFEPRWYLSRAFYEGVHFTFPKKDNTGGWIRKNIAGKFKVIREIPKAKKQLNGIRNLILKLKQKPVVYPDTDIIDTDDKENQEKEKEQALLQSRYVEHVLNEDMKLSKFKKKLIKNAQLYSCAFIQILNDGDKKEFKVYSPFEVSVYPTIGAMDDYPMFSKHISKRFEDLKGDGMYDQTALAQIEKNYKDGIYSNSVYLNSYMREKYGEPPKDTVVVDELYKIVKVEIDENGDMQGDKGEEFVPAKKVDRVQITAYIGTTKVRETITNLSRFPMSIFIWEDEPYETSLMEDLMPLNKAYDIFMSKLEHKVKKMDTGRYAMQAKENTKVITTNDGEFIRYKRFKPELMAEAGVPNAFTEAVNFIENDMKEIGIALTNASSLPTGVEAWRAIESVKELDYGSVGTQKDNLNECLTDLAEKLVEMIAYDQVETKNVIMKDEKGIEQNYKIIGQRGADITKLDTNNTKNLIVINPNRNIKIEIESGVTWTEQGKRGLTLDLVKEGILPKEMALETLKYGNIRDIVQKLIEEETYGKSIIDSNEFKLLPVELQQAIIKYLASGANTANTSNVNQTNNVK